MRDFYQSLHVSPTTASSAGIVFEARAHHFLQEGRTLEILPILSSSQLRGGKHLKYVYDKYVDDRKTMLRFTLPVLQQYRVNKDTRHTHELHVYYRPQISNFASVDSWVIVKPNPEEPPIVLAFQMTINKKEHDAKPIGLDRLRALVPEDAQVYYIVITPEEVTPEINVSADYLTAAFLNGRNVNKAFPVFHCKIEIAELFKPRLT